MTLRLLYVSHSFAPPGRPEANLGGMQRMAQELHAALAEHPEVELHSLLLETSWRWTHLRIAPFFLRMLSRIPRMVRRERIDAVLFSSLVTAWGAIPLRRGGGGTRWAAIACGRDVTLPVAAYQRVLLPRSFRALDRVFPISRATAAECLARGLSADKVELIPCGVDVGRFAAEPRGDARAALLRLLGPGAERIPPDALLLCSVGRHQERKGFHWFVERVMPLLPPDVHYLLAGAGPMTDTIRAAVRRNAPGDRVHLLGSVPDRDLATVYAGADLFVMPNVPVPGDMEGFGMVMLEAGASGTPTVAADLEGIRDAVHEGENGHRVPSGDAAAFARVILRYRDDRSALAALSRRTARFTANTFGWREMADRYVAALRRG